MSKLSKCEFEHMGEGGKYLELNLHLPGGSRSVFFRALGDTTLTPSADALLSYGLLPAMVDAGGQTLHIAGEVSAKLRRSLPQMQDIYHCWDSRLNPVACESEAVERSSSQARRVGCFFSGGADSFYSVLKNNDEVTDLIFVHGLDIPLDNTDLRNKVSANLRAIAAELGKNLIEVETDARAYMDEQVAWGEFGHGAVLATIGHLLSSQLSKVLIPSTHSYRDMFPWGSHPLLDPLWSSEALEFVHDGSEATRVNKIGLIAGSEVAMRHLRVCYVNPGSLYNCGRCEKCLRTMINLQVHGALEKCQTFPDSYSFKRLKRTTDVTNDNVRSFVIENIEELARNGNNPQLEKQLERLLQQAVWPKALAKYFKQKKRTMINNLKGGN
ncbi:hypothetical protein [Aliagarivorans taiwanensis]|uniref:hypothetical protein n=1 Tax=Aliagarivorans taiwanensis TaxID=561966 RepID=UPI0003FF111D|nr:hypothetical protein [Aliagarivorans taiwanensis]